jgi:hypothetical protein
MWLSKGFRTTNISLKSDRLRCNPFLLMNPGLEFRHVLAQLLRFGGVPPVTSSPVQLSMSIYCHQHLMNEHVPRRPHRCVPLAHRKYAGFTAKIGNK